MSEGERRLAAIMYTDIVGYTSLTQRDEALAMQLLEEHRRLVRPFFPKHNGREIKTVGDQFLVEFPSALEAVRCAFDIQQSMHEMNGGRLPEKQVQIRIGVHLGDVIHSQNDVYGDAVNVASRMEPLAMPGGICVSQQVYDHVRNKFEFPLASMGRRELKNVGEPVEVYRVVMPWEQASAAEAAPFPKNKIAILPFTSFSLDPNDAFFADGMTEEVISTISGISGLRVISRTSAMGYKGTTKKVKEIGRELEVGSVLEGSFRKAGNRIRVTAQLINVADDEHLWAQTYDKDLDDVFEVQSDVAKQVAEALRIRILSDEAARVGKRPTRNTDAYTAYLKGAYLYGKRMSERPVEAVKEAAQCFELAVKEDPGFAMGYVGLARCAVKLAEGGFEIAANMQKARDLCAKALELEPGLAEAHSSNGWALMYSYDLRGAEEEFRKAIQLNPSDASAHNGYHAVLSDRGRWAEALRQIETAVELDPLSPVFCSNHGWTYYYLGDTQRALELCKRAVDLGGSSARASVAYLYGKMRMFDEMKREYRAWVELMGDSFPFAELWVRASTAYLEGRKEALRGLLPEAEAHVWEENGPDAYTIARIYFYLGENDKGFDWLERSYSKREVVLLGVASEQDLSGVRTDPRYLDLLKRLGLD